MLGSFQLANGGSSKQEGRILDPSLQSGLSPPLRHSAVDALGFRGGGASPAVYTCSTLFSSFETIIPNETCPVIGHYSIVCGDMAPDVESIETTDDE
jgi:hypothetical protein